MNHGYLQSERLSRRATRTIGAAVAAIMLVTGAAWYANTNALASADEAPAAAVAAPIPHPVAGGRDSYADVVKVVAPAVVTIRTEGKAKMSPTQFHDDDMLRRFQRAAPYLNRLIHIRRRPK